MTMLVGNVILYVAAIGSLLTVAVYSRAPWQRSLEGRAFMSQVASIAVLTMTISARNIIGRFAAYDEIRLAAFGAVALVIWWQLSLVIRARLTEYRKRKDRV